jgi:hypothetical protein
MVTFDGGTYTIDFRAWAERESWERWQRALGRFPIFKYEMEHDPLPLIYWPEASYDHGKRLIFPQRSMRTCKPS